MPFYDGWLFYLYCVCLSETTINLFSCLDNTLQELVVLLGYKMFMFILSFFIKSGLSRLSFDFGVLYNWYVSLQVMVKIRRHHLLEGLWISVKEELVFQEVSVIAELQCWVTTAAGQFTQSGLRVGRQQLLWQNITTSPDVDDEEVERVSDTRCSCLTEENTGVQRRWGGTVAVELTCHWAGGVAHGEGGRKELMERWRVTWVKQVTNKAVYCKRKQITPSNTALH